MNADNARFSSPRTRLQKQSQPLYDEALFSRLQHLVLQSQHLSSTGLTGEHRSRRRGLSPEFSDFKPYSPGDDFRRIDWKTYARFDELFVRESETTTEYDIHILVDTSPSMDWSADDDAITKLRYSLQIAGAIAYLSLWHFDRITIGSLNDVAGKPLGPIQGRNHILPVFRFLERLSPTGGKVVASSLLRYVHSRSRPGIVIAISDLLDDDLAELEQTLQRLSARGWETCILRIEDPAEVDPNRLLQNSPNLELADSESGSRLQIHGGARTLSSYLADRQLWTSQLETLGKRQRTSYLTVSTDEPVETVVFSRLRSLGVVR
ncbi:MAG: DUF58 domain-containing protein [Thermomicrobiales bacterium]